VVAATETPAQPEVAIDEPAASNAPPAAAPGPAQTAPAREASRLPDYAAVLAEGIGLGALQMQLHVHSSVASSRFVVINGRRYSEGDTLAEGPLLEEIAAEGAVLSYRGRRFLLTSN
jgi:general secretion pathway protein B